MKVNSVNRLICKNASALIEEKGTAYFRQKHVPESAPCQAEASPGRKGVRGRGDMARVGGHQTTWDFENHVSSFVFILRARGSYGRALGSDLCFKKSFWLQNGECLQEESKSGFQGTGQKLAAVFQARNDGGLNYSGAAGGDWRGDLAGWVED